MFCSFSLREQLGYVGMVCPCPTTPFDIFLLLHFRSVYAVEAQMATLERASRGLPDALVTFSATRLRLSRKSDQYW